MTPAGKRNKRKIEAYSHAEARRANNPPVGLVTPETDTQAGKMRYAYDPHIDPQLQWAGKAEHTSFDVQTVSLHVHERIDPRAIIEAVRARNGNGSPQSPLFETPEENPPLRQAVEFYKHSHNWTNRMIAGDSLLVMNSLIEKEGMAGKVQTIYIDPPYGIRYGSNFQPFVNKRDVKDGADADLTAEPEQVRAFRDTWELGIHSYLTYLRDRLLLAREMLTDSGSVFVQISDENVHRVRAVMEEVFGSENFVAQITYKVTSGFERSIGPRRIQDYLVWYAKNKERCKFRRVFREKTIDDLDLSLYKYIEQDGVVRTLTQSERRNPDQIPATARVFRTLPLHTMGTQKREPREFEGEFYTPPPNTQWRHTSTLFDAIVKADRVMKEGRRIHSKLYLDDFPYEEHNTVWTDTGPEISKSFVVQTATKVIARCILMTTDPGDLVLDPTCGSGTTAYVAEQWGRRWVTCDTSRVALALARQRLMTAVYDYYELANPDRGVGDGFRYKTVPHVTLRSIANNPDIGPGMTREDIDASIARSSAQETLYDQPSVDRAQTRVSGPFTVEAVPAPVVKGLDDVIGDGGEGVMGEVPVEEGVMHGDVGMTGNGETVRQREWMDELLRTGIRGKSGQYIRFARLEPLPGMPDLRFIHGDGETLPNDDGSASTPEGVAASAHRVVVSFGPEHAPMEQRQVALAVEEAYSLVPKPRIVVFAAFQFDPEAAKDIDMMHWPGVALLKAQMNPDLLTDDLKKRRASNESFWLIGQPDVGVRSIRDGEDAGKWQVDVRGFDYYNTKTGDVESGDEDRIAVWMLDTDYDGRSLYPRQVFFPMAGPRDGWDRLSRSLRAEVDAELVESYRGTTSLPFEAGAHGRIAVKIVDDRGIESLRVVGLGE